MIGRRRQARRRVDRVDPLRQLAVHGAQRAVDDDALLGAGDAANLAVEGLLALEEVGAGRRSPRRRGNGDGHQQKTCRESAHHGTLTLPVVVSMQLWSFRSIVYGMVAI